MLHNFTFEKILIKYMGFSKKMLQYTTKFMNSN